MKKNSLAFMFTAAIIFLAGHLSGQVFHSDDILGTWLNEDKDAHVEIYKEGGKYYGKIIWLKEPIDEETGKPKLDDENADHALRDRPVMGLVMLKDFIFDGSEEWEDGTIYDPKNGKTYSCYMTFEDKDVLKIRGFIGISLIGRSTFWTRVR